MIKFIVAFVFLATTAPLARAGVEHTAIVEGVIQSWTDKEVELLSHGKLVLLPRSAFKSPLVEGKRVRILLPTDQLHSSPNERIKEIKEKYNNAPH